MFKVMSNSLFKAAISFCVVIELSDFSNWMQTILGKLHISYCKIKSRIYFAFFHSAMCILLNNHGYSLVCKYINVCLINDYVIVLFFEQIKMLYILYNEFTWFFLLRKYEHSYDIIRYQPNAYSITVGGFFFKWSST